MDLILTYTEKSYFHLKSEHPETLKQSVPYSQALRLKRICTTKELAQSNLKYSQSV